MTALVASVNNMPMSTDQSETFWRNFATVPDVFTG
jgi:hypothetical protein